jgi:hypothetical protein
VAEILFVLKVVIASVVSQVADMARAIDVPTVAISDSITAVSAGVAMAVRYGGQAVISPCQTCSKASRITPPHSSAFSRLSFSFWARLCVDSCMLVVAIARTIGTMKQAIFSPSSNTKFKYRNTD